ncbi:hypothetical protein EYF80_003289 [Liparis tanakae]|uniref:Uncharacterized protein n=1 Tax=Liparis tanakae TaxID=230148 RepID=A0A4Z2J8L7_9TELE|nr:hypothetical protein EYF80_003289 [Liparis tanakae]
MKDRAGRPGRVALLSQVENLISCRFLCSHAVPHRRSAGARVSADNSVCTRLGVSPALTEIGPRIPHGHTTSSTAEPRPDLAGVEVHLLRRAYG